ncbi:NUDIX hydrolase [Halobacteriales archaeon SW_7_68_16]|nr:MAG: NUDIX hydrolase [Halobacteriales archaeon SW_7_68_16]
MTPPADDDPLAWTTIDRETAYTCPGFDVVHESVALPDGTETDFDYVSEPPAVVALPLTPDGDAVVIEEGRQAVGHVVRGLPAGTVEPDEDAIAAATRRELEEETGYVADAVERIAVAEALVGIADSVHHHFVARGCTPTGERALDADESIRVTTTPYDDLLADVRAGRVRDARSALCVYHYEFGTSDRGVRNA